MTLLKEFKEFALKGNVLDLAIGLVIGAAFAKVVSSLVDDLLMPPLGMLAGHHDLSNYFLNLSPGVYGTLAEAKAAGAATINYGLFLNTIAQFLIIAFVVFLVVKRINAMRRAPAAETPSMRDCPECLSAVPMAARRCRFCTAALTAS